MEVVAVEVVGRHVVGAQVQVEFGEGQVNVAVGATVGHDLQLTRVRTVAHAHRVVRDTDTAMVVVYGLGHDRRRLVVEVTPLYAVCNGKRRDFQLS